MRIRPAGPVNTPFVLSVVAYPPGGRISWSMPFLERQIYGLKADLAYCWVRAETASFRAKR